MCNLKVLKSSAADYAAEHSCNPPGVARVQYALGYAHWLLTAELYKRGFTGEHIFYVTPLERTTIHKYLSKSRRNEEKGWNRSEYIKLEEIKSSVRRYVNDVDGIEAA